MTSVHPRELAIVKTCKFCSQVAESASNPFAHTAISNRVYSIILCTGLSRGVSPRRGIRNLAFFLPFSNYRGGNQGITLIISFIKPWLQKALQTSHPWRKGKHTAVFLQSMFGLILVNWGWGSVQIGTIERHPVSCVSFWAPPFLTVS